MLQLLIVFIGSGMIMGCILACKVAGFSGASLPGWVRFRTVGDERIAEDIASVKKFIKLIDKEHFYKVLYRALLKIRSWIRAFQHWLDRKLSRLKNLIRGRRTLTRQGRASHFLHDIKRSREKEREEGIRPEDQNSN